jgi:hypothetical protein
MKKRPIAALGVVLLACPLAARAQVAWDAPRLLGPESPGGLGVYWLRASSLEVETDAAMGTWGLPGTDGRIVLRGGAGVDEEDRVSAFGGVDLRAPLARHTSEQPLDLAWHAGVGAGGGAQDGQYLVVSVPMGISAGRSWTSGSVWLAPYASVGVVLDLNFGDDAPDDEFGVTPAVDVGVDVALDPDRDFVIRTAISLGDRQAFAIGLNLGG